MPTSTRTSTRPLIVGILSYGLGRPAAQPVVHKYPSRIVWTFPHNQGTCAGTCWVLVLFSNGFFNLFKSRNYFVEMSTRFASLCECLLGLRARIRASRQARGQSSGLAGRLASGLAGWRASERVGEQAGWQTSEPAGPHVGQS